MKSLNKNFLNRVWDNESYKKVTRFYQLNFPICFKTNRLRISMEQPLELMKENSVEWITLILEMQKKARKEKFKKDAGIIKH